jgi:hypothetical protein
MARFTRQNELVCTGVFAPVDGSSAAPSAAEAVLVYVDQSGTQVTAHVAMSVGADGVWSGVWDSSAAGEGYVEWTIRCWGGLVAAMDGSFYISANKANLAT